MLTLQQSLFLEILRPLKDEKTRLVLLVDAGLGCGLSGTIRPL